MYYWMKGKIEEIERFFFYGWKFRKSFDFDAHTIYYMLQIKLERIHQCMKTNSHLLWNDSEDTNLMRKLCEAKGLAKRLDEESYHKHYSRMAERYKNKDRDGFGFNLYPDAKIVDKKLYRILLHGAIKRDQKELETDKKRLFYLLEKYIQHFWD